MSSDLPTSQRLRVRDPFSAISHLVGALLGVAGLVYLVLRAAGDPIETAAFSVYGASLIALYSASAAYHASHRASSWLQRLDHGAIYLLIAGTYAPICVVALHGKLGFGMLGAEFGMALVGMVATFCWGGGPKWLRLVLYLGMGWLAVIALGPLMAAIGVPGIAWLLGGGAAYSLGTIIYASRRPKLWPGVFGAHDLWHVFVLAGSACHFMVMLTMLL